MSGTGDTGQELPGMLCEKDEKSETDNNVLAKKDEDVTQDIPKDACEALVASKNESVKDKELPVVDFSERKDSLSKSAEKIEEVSSNVANENSLAEELKSATDAYAKLESVECAEEKTAPNAVEISESSSNADVKEEVKAGLDEKFECVSVPQADEKCEAEADDGKHVPSASQGDVNQELSSGADKKDHSLPVIDVKAESPTTVDLPKENGGEILVSATKADKEDLTSAGKEELEPSTTVKADKEEDTTSVEEEELEPSTTAKADKEEDKISAERKELETTTTAEADEEEATTSTEKKELEPTTTADESAASKEAESAPTAEADVNQESGSRTATKEDSAENADEQSNSTPLSDESNATSAVTEEKPKEEDFMDILGNGTLLKKVLEKGHGNRPNMGDEIIIQVSQEIPELDKTFPEEQLQYVLGDGDVLQALDLAVALMEVGEKAVVIAGYKYMYGDLGLEPDIPPRSNFKLTVKLVKSNGPLDYPTMDFDTRFAEAKKKKERGNFLFKRKEFTLALNSYMKASRILDPALGCVYNDESAENLQKLLEFRAIILCNTSAAQFKLEAYDAAVKSALDATRLLPTYHKAHVRLGQAYEKLGNTEQTIRSYKLALKHDTDNSKWIHGELERLTKLSKKSKQSQQEMYSKMFWGDKPPTLNGKPVKPEEVASLLFNPNQGPSTSSAPEIDAEKVWYYAKCSIMWQLGIFLGTRFQLGEMEQEEVDRISRDFADRFNNGGVPLTSAQLSAFSKDLAPYVPADVCQLIEDRCRYLDNQNAVPKIIGSPSVELKKMPDLAAAEKSKPVSESVEKPVSRHQPQSGIMYYEGTDVDTGLSTMSATPPKYVQELKALEADAKHEAKKTVEPKKEEPKKKSSWMWKTGATLVGAGLVGLAGIGIYKYMNH